MWLGDGNRTAPHTTRADFTLSLLTKQTRARDKERKFKDYFE